MEDEKMTNFMLSNTF